MVTFVTFLACLCFFFFSKFILESIKIEQDWKIVEIISREREIRINLNSKYWYYLLFRRDNIINLSEWIVKWIGYEESIYQFHQPLLSTILSSIVVVCWKSGLDYASSSFVLLFWSLEKRVSWPCQAWKWS